jgi:hypothetical protein
MKDVEWKVDFTRFDMWLIMILVVQVFPWPKFLIMIALAGVLAFVQSLLIAAWRAAKETWRTRDLL